MIFYRKIFQYDKILDMQMNNKRETLIQNITYMALMAAINVIFVLLTTFVPVLFFLIVFVLPLTSVLVTIHCKKIYFPIYALATIGLCMICTIWRIDDTIFYVIPSIISGFAFGFMIEKRVPSYWIILITTLLQIGFTYASIPLIKLLTGRNIIEVFAIAFGIGEFQYLDYVTPCFIFFISLAQEILAFMIIKEEIKKFGIELDEPKYLPLSLCISLCTSVVLAIIFIFIYGPISYLMTLISIFLGIYALIYLILENNKIIYALLIGTFILSVFLFAIFYPMVKEPLGLVFINIFFVMEGIIVLINNYLMKHTNKDTIN